MSEHASERPQGSMALGIGDILSGLWRALWLMLFVFIVIFAVGFFIALKMPSSYEAGASIMVQLGPDYVYQPKVGDAARGAIADSEQLVLAETEIMQSSELYKRVIKKIGYKALFPNSAKLANPVSEKELAASEAAAIKLLAKGVTVSTAPKSNVVRLSFKHENPQTAALVLNTLIESYVDYRREVFVDQSTPALLAQKADFDSRLNAANNAYQQFLERNGVVDFATARQTYTKIYDQVMTDLYATETQISTLRARIDRNRRNLGEQSQEVGLERQVDLSIPTKLRDLRAQREELLTRYLPGSEPVVAIDNQIATLEDQLAVNGVTDKELKIGRNPVHQELLTNQYNAEAELASLISRKQQLETQALEVMRKMQNLYALEAENYNLAAERNALSEQIGQFTTRIEETKASNALSKGGNNIVRIISPATPPSDSKSLKKPVMILAFLLGALAALAAGLLKVFLNRRFTSAEMAERTLDLPVLARAPAK